MRLLYHDIAIASEAFTPEKQLEVIQIITDIHLDAGVLSDQGQYDQHPPT